LEMQEGSKAVSTQKRERKDAGKGRKEWGGWSTPCVSKRLRRLVNEKRAAQGTSNHFSKKKARAKAGLRAKKRVTPKDVKGGESGFC